MQQMEFYDEEEETEGLSPTFVFKYFFENFVSQMRSTAPIVCYLLAFALVATQIHIEGPGSLFIGIMAVVLGLTVFLEGLKLGVMPFCEVIGTSLPRAAPRSVMMAVFFALGIGVTLSEPAIGALRTIGSLLPPASAPYLYLLLNDLSMTLQLSVGVGVGFAAVIGMLRQLNGWDLKRIIAITTIPTVMLSIFVVSVFPELEEVVSLAWDCGAVTTGPVTVPVILALGIGVSASASAPPISFQQWFQSLCSAEGPAAQIEDEFDEEGDADAVASESSELDCFGIVTLASLFPVLVVQLLGIFCYTKYSKEEILGSVVDVGNSTTAAETGVSDTVWFHDIFDAFRAIVPLLIFLVLVLRLLCRVPFPIAYIKSTADEYEYALRVEVGLALSVLGLVIFNFGLSYGLIVLGSVCGDKIGPLAKSPLSIAFVVTPFSFFLGLMATLAEPALGALGSTVERLSKGRFKCKTLIFAVAIGVASGVTLGILRILFEWRLLSLVVPGYGITLALTYFSNKEYVAIAWDSAGVTTGPVTVPLVLALGMGVSNAAGSGGGFGILSCASFCPIMSVLICGLYLDRQGDSGEVAYEDATIELDMHGGAQVAQAEVQGLTQPEPDVEANASSASATELSLPGDEDDESDEQSPKPKPAKQQRRRQTFDAAALSTPTFLQERAAAEDTESAPVPKGRRKHRHQSVQEYSSEGERPQARDFQKKFPTRRKKRRESLTMAYLESASMGSIV